jgi:hypothetical protein
LQDTTGISNVVLNNKLDLLQKERQQIAKVILYLWNQVFLDNKIIGSIMQTKDFCKKPLAPVAGKLSSALLFRSTS